MKENMKFETALAELEKIVAKLEQSDTPLDEALKLYEKGVALIRVCNARLDSTEEKIRLLQEEKDGFMTDIDFDEQ